MGIEEIGHHSNMTEAFGSILSRVESEYLHNADDAEDAFWCECMDQQDQWIPNLIEGKKVNRDEFFEYHRAVVSYFRDHYEMDDDE